MHLALPILKKTTVGLGVRLPAIQSLTPPGVLRRDQIARNSIQIPEISAAIPRPDRARASRGKFE